MAKQMIEALKMDIAKELQDIYSCKAQPNDNMLWVDVSSGGLMLIDANLQAGPGYLEVIEVPSMVKPVDIWTKIEQALLSLGFYRNIG